MDKDYENARDQFFAAIRTLAASTDGIQERLRRAYEFILLVKIDEFENDPEMTIRFARILDQLSTDTGTMDASELERAATMADMAAIKAADTICDFYYDLG